MKNLMKTSLYLLSFTFLFISCGDSSKKGAWSSSDMDKCKSEIKKGMYEDDGKEEVDEMLSSFGKTMDQVSACMCEEFEKKFSSFEEADNEDKNSMSEEEAGKLMMTCCGLDLPDETYESADDTYETVSSRNLTYMCPLCEGVTEFSCPDCDNDLIWCVFDRDVTSYHCPTCEWNDFLFESCAHCNKELRSSTKFWTNKSGENHSDCEW